MTSPPSIALACCMRNEGVFLLEWLAYHAGLGFDQIIVVTNECEDGSDLLLDRLHDLGLVTHIRQTVPVGEHPQQRGMDHVLSLCRAQGYSHLLHVDSDEFVDLDEAEKGIRVLIDAIPDADVIPLAWRFFGNAGVSFWTPGDLVLEKNPKAESKPDPDTTKVKCLFKIASFAGAADHAPLAPLVPNPVVRAPDGCPLKNIALYRRQAARFRPYKIMASGRVARLSHYAVRSLDVFLMKNDRGKGTGTHLGTKYQAGGRWYQTCNRNDQQDKSMLRYIPGVKIRMRGWLQDPETARLQQRCFDWFETRRKDVLTQEQLDKWSDFNLTS